MNTKAPAETTTLDLVRVCGLEPNAAPVIESARERGFITFAELAKLLSPTQRISREALASAMKRIVRSFNAASIKVTVTATVNIAIKSKPGLGERVHKRTYRRRDTFQEQAPAELLEAREALIGGAQVQLSAEKDYVQKLFERDLSPWKTLLTRDQETEFFRRIRGSDAEDAAKARDEFLLRNIGLARLSAYAFRDMGVPVTDLTTEGVVGLLRAIEKFEPKKGFKFSTYAINWTDQAVMRAVQKQRPGIRIPAHIVERYRGIRKVSNKLHEVLGEEPTPEEIAEAMELPVEKVIQAQRALQGVSSLDKPVSDDENGTSLGSLLADPNAQQADENAERSMLREYLERRMSHLTDRERTILEMHFGFGTESTMTLEEIGEVYQVTRERIRQVEGIALSKLRRQILKEKNPDVGGLLGTQMKLTHPVPPQNATVAATCRQMRSADYTGAPAWMFELLAQQGAK